MEQLKHNGRRRAAYNMGFSAMLADEQVLNETNSPVSASVRLSLVELFLKDHLNLTMIAGMRPVPAIGRTFYHYCTGEHNCRSNLSRRSGDLQDECFKLSFAKLKPTARIDEGL